MTESSKATEDWPAVDLRWPRLWLTLASSLLSEEHDSAMSKLTFAWTSSAYGDADWQTAGPCSGEIKRLVTIPGAAGVQPTDQYNITLVDEDGVDVLNGGPLWKIEEYWKGNQ
jgi:hypothetical protein